MKEYYKAHVWRFYWEQRDHRMMQHDVIKSGADMIIAPTLEDARSIFKSKYQELYEDSHIKGWVLHVADPVYQSTIERDVE